MNKSFRSVRNERLGAWVAAPVTTAVRRKRSKRARASVAAVIAVATGSLAGWAPTGALAQYANAFGTAIGTGAIALGSNGAASATADDSLAGSIAIGDGANASSIPDGSSIALGTGAFTSSPTGLGDSVAVGTASRATGQDAVAIGGQAWASGTNAISIGGGNDGAGGGASGANAVVLGAYGIANQTSAVAVGTGASALGIRALALGDSAVANHAGDVALGANATTAAAVGTASSVINGATYAYAGTAPTSTVSVGTAGDERTVTHVAAGRVSATSTDAVNGSQLFATHSAIASVANTPLTFSGNTGSVDRKLGDTLAITGLGTTGGTYSGANLRTVVVGNEVRLQMTDTPVFNSVITGNSTLDTHGLTIVGGPRVTASGIDANNTVITHVAPGTSPTDAVNLQQMQAVQSGAVNYATYADGSVNYNEVTLGNGQAANGTVVSNVAPGVAGTDAVNVNQLHGAIAGLGNSVNQLRTEVAANRRDADSGTAGAMAMAGMPQAYLPGKSMVAAGVASYRGQTAIAIGMSRISDNGKWVAKFTGSANSRGNVGVAVGAGYQW